MADDFIDWEISLSAGRSIPEWMWKNPFQVRFFRSAIEAARGPLEDGTGLEAAFNEARERLEQAASRKIIAMEGEFEIPLAITGPDVID